MFTQGVLSKGRADCLRQMPLQDCDVLLHEAGAPPIHTPLTVLQSLPDNIRSRLYVVHTSALPPDSGLRVAPTGTSGTIRLDDTTTSQEVIDCVGNESGQYENGVSSRGAISRPACISDAWFVLNLISNIPFFSSLSYVYTMEVLEIASVYEISCGDIVVPARKRQNTLCVVWEGTCIECDGKEVAGVSPSAAVWHAGDWTSPVILQPNNAQAAKVSDDQEPKDMIALSEQGVKVIIISMHELNKVLMRGSKLYRKYVGIEDKHGQVAQDDNVIGSIHKRVEKPASRHVVDVIKINSLLGNLYAGQVRALEAIAEGPRLFEPGSYLWKSGSGCDFAYLIATGSAHYVGVSGRRRSIGMNTYGSSRNVLETVYGKTIEIDKMLHDLPPESEFARLDLLMALRDERMCDDPDYRTPDRPEKKLSLAQSDRNANKAFARLYASRKAIDGLVVSRGCFVCDTAKMVAGELVNETDGTTTQHLHS